MTRGQSANADSDIQTFLDRADVIFSAVSWAIAVAANDFINEFVRRFIADPLEIRKPVSLRIGSYDVQLGDMIAKAIQLVLVVLLGFAVIRLSHRFLGWS